MCATRLMLATLETMRHLAATPRQLRDRLPVETQTLIAACLKRHGIDIIFAPPGQQLPPLPEERALLNCLSLASVDPERALQSLPTTLRDSQAEIIWAMAELFRFICIERAAALRD